MNISQFITNARKVLNEDAGSEGFLYKITSKNAIKEVKTEEYEITESKKDGDVYTAQVAFTYPHDYGFAIQTLKEAVEGLDIQGMQLIY